MRAQIWDGRGKTGNGEEEGGRNEKDGGGWNYEMILRKEMMDYNEKIFIKVFEALKHSKN